MVERYEAFVRKEFVFFRLVMASAEYYGSTFFRSSEGVVEALQISGGSWCFKSYRSSYGTYMYVYDTPLARVNRLSDRVLRERMAGALRLPAMPSSADPWSAAGEYHRYLCGVPPKYCIAAMATDDGVVRDVVSGEELAELPTPKRMTAYMSKPPAQLDRAYGLEPRMRGLRARVWAGEPVTEELLRAFWPKPEDRGPEVLGRIREACGFARWPCEV
jgi:hypothetical protein